MIIAAWPVIPALDRFLGASQRLETDSHGTSGNIGGLYKCDDAGNAGCYLSDCGTDNQFPVPSGSLLRVGPAVTSALGLVAQTSPSTSTGQSSTSSASTSQSTTATPTPTPGMQKKSGSLSTGAAAGIGLGVGIPLLIICATFIWLFLKEKRRSKSWMETQKQSGFSQSQPEKMPAPQYAAAGYTPVHEIDHGQQRAEIDHGQSRAQLP